MIDRRAYAMIEVITAMTVGSVILGASVSTLTLLVRMDRADQEHVHRMRVLPRLAEQFRADVHAAGRPVPVGADANNEWRLALDGDRSVTYHFAPGLVERREAAGAKSVRQEAYALAPDHTARVSTAAAGTPPLASLILAPAAATSAAERSIRIDAVVGRDRRLVEPQPRNP